MDRAKGVITSKNIMDATQMLMNESYTKSVAGGSVLELLLVVAMSRLHRIRRFPSFNFNHVANELKTMAGIRALPFTLPLATASI